MKERPILFSAQMVRAILDGRKTMTRRAVKGVNDVFTESSGPDWHYFTGPDAWRLEFFNGNAGFADFRPLNQQGSGIKFSRDCPYGKPGDRLWVREAWRIGKGYDPLPGSNVNALDAKVWYEADGSRPTLDWVGRYRHSRFMPRWASSITLEITGVRVERLQDISEQDAIAEGMRAVTGDGGGRGSGCKWNGVAYEGARAGLFHAPGGEGNRCCCKVAGPSPAQCAFRDLWDSINAERAPWASNPWVWVVEFKRLPLH